MKPKSTDSPKYQQQRLAAIRAAAAVFAEKGFHGASTADIAAHLGIKQGSLYYYFDSKEEALEEVCLYGIREYAEHMDEIVRSDQTFEAKLVAIVTNHLTSYRERNEALRVHNTERLYLPKERRGRLKNVGSHYREQLQTFLENAVANGTLRNGVDSRFAAQAIIGLCNSFGELIARDDTLSIFGLVKNCSDLLLSGLTSRK